jgi:hypothetical protein
VGEKAGVAESRAQVKVEVDRVTLCTSLSITYSLPANARRQAYADSATHLPLLQQALNHRQPTYQGCLDCIKAASDNLLPRVSHAIPCRGRFHNYPSAG